VVAGRQQFLSLTGIRFIAASMVFAYHNRKYWRGDVPDWLLRLLNEGHMGVTLFFVLSGFLIAYTYGNQPIADKRSYLSYLLTRLARVFPLYWIILSLSYFDNGFPDASSAIRTYSLFHAFSDLHSLDGIAQSWTLNLELCFYALAPFIFTWMADKPVKAWIYTALLFLPAWLTGYIWHAANGNPDSFLWPASFLLHGTFFGRFPEFLTGVMLAIFLKRNLNSNNLSTPRNSISGFAGMVFSLWLMGQMQPDIFHHGADHPLGPLMRSVAFPAFAALFMYGLITEKTYVSRFLSSRLIVLLGNASFAFYLIHISYVNLKIKSWHLFADRNYILLWLVSIAIYLLIEKPIYWQCRKWISKINPG
jgi:peptidoglycan/LPS O-acetylase OafA/YrhL